jgi:hypothetical protein
MSNGAELPDDVETLRALLLEARAQLAERDLEIEQLKAQRPSNWTGMSHGWHPHSRT